MLNSRTYGNRDPLWLRRSMDSTHTRGRRGWMHSFADRPRGPASRGVGRIGQRCVGPRPLIGAPARRPILSSHSSTPLGVRQTAAGATADRRNGSARIAAVLAGQAPRDHRFAAPVISLAWSGARRAESSMLTLEDIFPPFRLRILGGPVELRVLRDDDLPELVELVHSGIQVPDLPMPFLRDWHEEPFAPSTPHGFPTTSLE